jgi:hypothetical protein
MVRTLLSIRAERIVPLLAAIGGHAGRAAMLGEHAFQVVWTTADGNRLTLLANLDDRPIDVAAWPDGEAIHQTPTPAGEAASGLGSWSVRWFLYTP